MSKKRAVKKEEIPPEMIRHWKYKEKVKIPPSVRTGRRHSEPLPEPIPMDQLMGKWKFNPKDRTFVEDKPKNGRLRRNVQHPAVAGRRRGKRGRKPFKSLPESASTPVDLSKSYCFSALAEAATQQQQRQQQQQLEEERLQELEGRRKQQQAQEQQLKQRQHRTNDDVPRVNHHTAENPSTARTDRTARRGSSWTRGQSQSRSPSHSPYQCRSPIRGKSPYQSPPSPAFHPYAGRQGPRRSSLPNIMMPGGHPAGQRPLFDASRTPAHLQPNSHLAPMYPPHHHQHHQQSSFARPIHPFTASSYKQAQPVYKQQQQQQQQQQQHTFLRPYQQQQQSNPAPLSPGDLPQAMADCSLSGDPEPPRQQPQRAGFSQSFSFTNQSSSAAASSNASTRMPKSSSASCMAIATLLN